MPLSAPAERELVHTRTLEMTVHRRPGGAYDVEGHLVDVKPFAYELLDGHLAPGEPIHDMWLRLTVGRDAVVREVETVMDAGAHRPCRLVTPAFGCLVGLQIGAGWNRAVRERLGGARGCTHLVEMLAQMATTALQAQWAEQEAEDAAAGRPMTLDPAVLDTCHTYRSEGEFVRVHFGAGRSEGGR